MIARLCFAFTAGLACAQSPPPLEIRGTVVEGALGIGGVTVTLYEFGHTPAEATTRSVFATTSTDSKGEFTFHPARTGEYYVEVQKEGYFAESVNGPSSDLSETTGDPVRIEANHPLQERKFSLMRLGELRGRVVDEDGKPLVNLRVGIRPGTVTPVVTDQDGYFTATRLRPGDYSVSVVRRSPEILPQFSEEDLKLVDYDLQTSNTPDVPVPVRSGASLSVGTITARKTPYYRAHLSVQVADCAPGEKWIFSTTSEMAGFGPQIPCGKEFLVRNLSPGSYTCTLVTAGRPGEKTQWAFAPLEVTDHNLEVATTMSPGADISGRFVTPEGTAPSAMGRARINMNPIAGPMVGTQYVAADVAGAFIVRGLPEIRHRVSVDALDGKFYVKEILYNGLAAPDGIITPVGGAPTLLEIIIDDKPATISGLVAERDKVRDRVMIVAIKWPVRQEDASTSTLLRLGTIIPADDQGRFQIGGLAPGEYRILAVATDSLSRVQPDIVNQAEKITLERGGSQSISLKIVEP